MFKRIFLWLLVAIVAVIIALFVWQQVTKSPEVFAPSTVGLYQAEFPAPEPQSLRRIAQGEVTGVVDNYDTFAWLGIPYAQPPVGDLRWRAPLAPKAFDGVFEATQYQQPCTQFWGLIAGVDGEDGGLVGDEDCLSLNIWAPDTKPEPQSEIANYPVMVWIHGGSNDSGSANLFQAHHLAGSKKVVVVGVNYRLGILGWLSHDAIRATADNLEDASGNYGTLDIIAALKWVQQNIQSFGGDPNNVTIFGESAGGRNVYSMMASPLAKGLFHRAIVQSGTVDTTKLVLAEDFADNKLTADESGYTNSSNELISVVLQKQYPSESKSEIRQRIVSMPPAELMDILRAETAQGLMRLAEENYGRTGYIEVANVLRDGHVLPKESTLRLLSDPRSYNAVPLMTGTTRDENKLFMFRNPEHVETKLGFIPSIKDEARYNRVSELVSDNWKAGTVDEPAKVISASGEPVYAYRFDWDDYPFNPFTDLSVLLGASHGFEISFVFGDFTGGTPTDVTEDKQNAERRKALSLSMMDYWAEFAYNGNPGRGQTQLQPEWREWSDAGHNLIVLDEASDGGIRMAELRHDVIDIKNALASDDILTSTIERCRGYANLFLHGYQTDDFFDPAEYREWGCENFPVGQFRSK
ncbi:MAG: carboxylesterase family protein [Pseudomonadota bacterium]